MIRKGLPVLLLIIFTLHFQTSIAQEKPIEFSRKEITLANVLNSNYQPRARVYVNAKDQNTEWVVKSDNDLLKVVPEQGKGNGFVDLIPDSELFDTSLEDDSGAGTVLIHSGLDTFNLDEELYCKITSYYMNQSSPPIGAVDKPESGSTVSGQVIIGGWALDDVAIDGVEIYKVDNDGEKFLGEAALVEGIRPDQIKKYPDYPENYKGGWEFPILTHCVPDDNGTHMYKAVARDVEGNRTDLGTTTIHVDNENAVKPFGAIDSPKNGGKAFGTNFRCTGWALTPLPNMLYECGSDIQVLIDGQNVGTATYNGYRSDIASLFPDYQNANGAGAFFEFDTTPYENGVHTIQWVATDNVGNTDGIGTRYFTIENSTAPAAGTSTNNIKAGAPAGGSNLKRTIPQSGNEIQATGPYNHYFQVFNKGEGILNWQVETKQDWIVLDPPTGTGPGWVQVTLDPSGLPVGQHHGTIVVSEINNASASEYVSVKFTVNDITEPPFGEFISPAQDQVVSGNVQLSGWALDDIGVQSVKILLKNENELQYIGDAVQVESTRPDVQSMYKAYPFVDCAGWNYSLSSHEFENGEYVFAAEVEDYEGNVTLLQSASFIIDNANAVLPFGDIDAPADGQIVSGENVEITGWVLAVPPNTIQTDGSTIFVYLNGEFIGKPIYNLRNETVAQKYPGYLNAENAGFTFYLNTTQFTDGVYTLNLMTLDDAGNANKTVGARTIKIVNTVITRLEDENTVPLKTDLMNAYPNPFNPSTQIEYHLAQNATVNVHVYDIMGRLVRTLVDNRYQQAGKYSIRFNTLGISSSVYFCRFTAGHESFVKKLMFIK